MKKIFGFLLTFLIFSTPLAALASSTFVDVLPGHPYNQAIEFLASRKIINGYSDGTFKPFKNLNRAEAVKIISIAKQTGQGEQKDCYKDVKKNDWFSAYACSAVFISGYGDGYFRPGNPVNIAEALKMMFTAYKGDYALNPAHYHGQWYDALINQAMADKFIARNVKGNDIISRGAFADMLYRFISSETSSQSQTAAPHVSQKKDTAKTAQGQRFTGSFSSDGRFVVTNREPDFDPPTPSGDNNANGGQSPVMGSGGGSSGGNGNGSSGSGTGDDSGAEGGGTSDGGGSGGTGGSNGDTGGSGSADSSTEGLILTPPNFKVAFFGDGGLNDRYRSVLNLVKQEDADMVIHNGDIVNDEGEELPGRWLNLMSQILDTNGTFPYFFSMGNHDEDDWLGHTGFIGYRELLQNRLNSLGVIFAGNANELGVKTAFSYNGLFIALAAPGFRQDFTGSNHASFLREQLSSSNNLWKICSWHKMMRAMQIGGKGDDTGWDVYEACRESGAIIGNGHEHSYARTNVLSDMSEQIVADNSSPFTIQPGQTFSFHAGTSAQGLRDQERCFPETYPYGCNGEWAKIYTTSQHAVHGALFIEFYVDGDPRKAHGYFKNINGEIVDEFELYNNTHAPGADSGSGNGGNGDSGGTGETGDDEDDTGTGTPAEEPGEEFVQANGTQLMLNGEDFRFVGANAYGAANDRAIYLCGPYADYGRQPDRFLDSMFRVFRDNGMTVMRFWAFQAFTNGGTNFSALDRVFRYANQYGIKVIPTLENQWDHCPGNIHKYSDWYAEGYKHPYGNYPLSFRQYVERVVTRYKNEPAILMWQILNEAESRTPDGRNDAASLFAFTRDISALIKSIDSNHLVNLGTMGSGQPGTENEHFRELHAINTIDVVEGHDYDHEEESLPAGHNSVANALSVAQSLNKPFFIGEAGIQAGGGNYTYTRRAELFRAKISALLGSSGIGYLIWRWDNSRSHYGQGCNTGYCFTENDPLLQVLESF